MVRRLKENEVYTIARLVMFQDNVLAKAHPHLAAQQADGAGLWFDEQGFAWLDPFQNAVWVYLRRLVQEVAALGFDEILLSACHFAPVGAGPPPRWYGESTPISRARTITAFVGAVRGSLGRRQINLAVDVPGRVCWREDEAQIGFQLAQVAPLVDTLCPVLWPQEFPQGVPVSAAGDGFEAVIFQTLRHLGKPSGGQAVALRPWLQVDPHQPAQLRQQVGAAINGGASGFMGWNSSASYPQAGYG
jgi:hypothetical protein